MFIRLFLLLLNIFECKSILIIYCIYYIIWVIFREIRYKTLACHVLCKPDHYIGQNTVFMRASLTLIIRSMKKNLDEWRGKMEVEVKCLLMLDFLFNKSLLSSFYKDSHNSH